MDAASANIKVLLEQDLAGYTELLKLLNQEKHLLVNRDFDAFAAILEKKHTQLLLLDQACTQRANLLSSLGLQNDNAGMQKLFDQQPEFGRDELQKMWLSLQDRVNACSRQNQINAKIAHRAQTTSRQILNLLKGAPLAASLYGKSGTTSGDETGLSITRA